MKKTLLPLSLLIVVGVVMTCLQQPDENKLIITEKKLPHGIQGAIEYVMQARINFETGRVNSEDVWKSWEQADALNTSANKNSTAPRLYWQELGPDNVGGRTYAILFDKNNPGKIFAGGVSGGLWISNNGGTSWTKYSDQLDNLAVSCIAQASNGDIYFGTGEIAFSGSSPNIGFWINSGGAGIAGKGIWKSSDGGNTFNRITSTWETASSTDKTAFSVTYRIAIDPNNPNRIYAATQSGLRMSNDGGNTWTNPLCITATCVVKHTADVVDVDVTPAGVVFAVANNGTQLYRSPNGNDSTFVRNYGIPSSAGRIEIAVSPSNAAYAYASVCDASQKILGFYQSSDSGNTWTALANPPSDPFATQPPYYQGWYDNVIIVDPSNPQRFIMGGVTLRAWSQTNGWTTIGSNVHADHHGFAYHPTDANILINGNDGGLYISNNAKQNSPTFTTLNKGYNVTQFYAVAAALTGEVMGGTQDNGTPYIDYTGATPQTSKRILGGDGGYVDFSTINPNAYFATSQLGAIRRSSNKGTSFSKFTDANVGDPPDGGFVTVFRLWEKKNGSTPVDTTYFLATNTAVWATKEALNFSKTPKWFKVATLPAAARSIEVSDDGKTVFVGTIQSGNTGRLVRITGLDYVDNSLANFDLTTGTPITTTTIATFSQCVTGVALNPLDPDKIIVTLGNYGYTSNIYRSYNALAATPVFASIQNNLPNMPVYSAVIDRTDTSLVVLGTELGMFASQDGGVTWAEENAGMARTAAFMVRQQYLNSAGKYAFYIGTYGRGIFRSVSTTVGTEKPNTFNNISGVSLFPSPAVINATVAFAVEKTSEVTVTLMDLRGRVLIRQYIPEARPGRNELDLDVSSVPSGTYFVSVRNESAVRSEKLLIIK